MSSIRKLLPIDGGGAVLVFQTDTSRVFVSAYYFKRQLRKFSFHNFLVRDQLCKQFGATTIDTSNTLPQVQTIKTGHLDAMEISYQVFALYLKDYLKDALGLCSTDKISKHCIQFDMIIQSRSDPDLLIKVPLFMWTERRIEVMKSQLSKKIKLNKFDKYLDAITVAGNREICTGYLLRNLKISTRE